MHVLGPRKVHVEGRKGGRKGGKHVVVVVVCASADYAGQALGVVETWG